MKTFYFFGILFLLSLNTLYAQTLSSLPEGSLNIDVRQISEVKDFGVINNTNVSPRAIILASAGDGGSCVNLMLTSHYEQYDTVSTMFRVDCYFGSVVLLYDPVGTVTVKGAKLFEGEGLKAVETRVNLTKAATDLDAIGFEYGESGRSGVFYNEGLTVESNTTF